MASCDHFMFLQNTLYETYSSLASSVGSWMDEVAKEILKEGSGSPSSHMARLWQEVKDEASRIYEDLKYDGVIPKYETIRRLAEIKIVRSLTKGCSMLWAQWATFQRQFEATVSDTIRTLQSEFDDITKVIIEGEILLFFKQHKTLRK